MYSSREPIGEIVGEQSPNGSRSRPLQDLISFLSRRDASGYVSGCIHIYGSWHIGKRTVIERAIERATEAVTNSPHTFIVHIQNERYEPLSPKTLALLIAKKLPANLPSYPNRRTKTRFVSKDYENLVEQLDKALVGWIDKTLDKHLNSPTRSVEVVVIQFRASQTDVSYDLLREIFAIQPRHIPARKVIVQSRNALSLGWETSREPIWLSAFKDDNECAEVRDFIQQRLRDHLDERDGHMLDVVKQVISTYCGRHPGLLKLVCSFISRANFQQATFMDRSTFTEAVECLLASHEKEWSSQIEELLDSLSEDARKAARDSRRHVELEHNGLVDSQGQPVEILRKYFQLTQEAGGTMMLGEMLSKLALSEAMNKAKPTLNRVWKEIFPPTPLYVAALEKAVKEVREAWQAEGISPLPQLDIKAAMGSFDWATLDVERIRDLPDVSLTNIIRQLMTVVEGVDDPSLKRRFISMVVETAEKKFQQALALDEGGDQLWKSYIIEVQRRLERTASEILGRISELEIALGARLVKDPDSGEVRTLIEVLGPRNSVDGQTRVRLPRPSREIAYISRAEFWDKYQALWSEWHGLRAVKKAWEMQYQPLHYRSLTPEGLIEPLQQEYKEAATKLAEFESQINQIEADLFAMAERARQISDESFGG